MKVVFFTNSRQIVLKFAPLTFSKKMPVQNNLGHDFWGSKRLKSPEEYTLGAPIASRTNVFKVGPFPFIFLVILYQSKSHKFINRTNLYRLILNILRFPMTSTNY